MTIVEIEIELKKIEEFPESCMDDLRRLAILQTKLFLKISFALEPKFPNTLEKPFKIKTK